MSIYDELVSVITPCYNSEKHLERLINSVSRQSIKVLEHIIIDDGSCDNSLLMLENFAKKNNHIKVLSQENLGAGAARNKGIKIARGKYIAFLDADDDWLEDKLKSQIAFMENNEIIFSYGNYFKVNGIDESSVGHVISPIKLIYSELLKGCPIGCLTVAYNQEYLGKIYMPNIRRGQDYALWLIIMRSGIEAHRYPGILANYRITDNSLSKNKVKKSLDIFNIYHKQEKLGLLQSIYYLICFSISSLKK